MAKLQITLTDEEARVLQIQAEKLDYNLIKFVKFLLAKEAYEALSQGQSVKQGVR